MLVKLQSMDKLPNISLGHDRFRSSYQAIYRQANLVTSCQINLAITATDEALEEAIELSQLGPLIASLLLGLDTPLDSRGTTLWGGGEIKRVTIARVVLKSAPILLLDEPTEGLDLVSERQVLSSLFAWATERSVLWVTHRLPNLSLVDPVAVIADGRIVDHGSPEMVMQSNALARRMMRYQLLTCNWLISGLAQA